MENYSVKVSTDGYTASRTKLFSGRCEITLYKGLSLKMAQRILLGLFNNNNEGEYYAKNWGIAVKLTHNRVFGANPTHPDGTRSFEYDGKRFFIEKEEEIELPF